MTLDPYDLDFDLLTHDHGPFTLAAMRTVSLVPRWVSNMTLTDTSDFHCECDSHADTTMMGRSALVITDYNQPVQVQGYDPVLGIMTYPTILAV